MRNLRKELLRNKKNLTILIIILIALPLTVLIIQKVQKLRSGAAGANASLTIPTSLSATVNNTVNVPISLNTDSANVRGVDISLNFDPTKLQLVGITPDAASTTTFKTFAPVDSTGAFNVAQVITNSSSGKVEFGAVTFDWGAQAVTNAFNGVTQLATVQFKALTSGTSTVSFNMTPGVTTDTNIVLDSNPPQDLLTQASQVNSLTITASGPTNTPTPTGVNPSATPTIAITVTPTRTPTPTLIPTTTSSPTPTTAPTLTSAPTATPVPNSTKLSFVLLLHGVGNGGDNVSPTSGGNTNPLTPQRTLAVSVYNSLNQLVLQTTGTIGYRSATGDFAGVIDAGTTLTSGAYLVTVQTPKYLPKQLPGIQNITANSTNTMSSTALVVGDSNGDGVISILDYNIIIDCFSELLPAKNCTDPAKKTSADLNDDGNVDSIDYNLFLRELSVQH